MIKNTVPLVYKVDTLTYEDCVEILDGDSLDTVGKMLWHWIKNDIITKEVFTALLYRFFRED